MQYFGYSIEGGKRFRNIDRHWHLVYISLSVLGLVLLLDGPHVRVFADFVFGR